ncbi:transcriptional regulator, AraC family, partial [Rhizobium sp. PDO1-076]|uniref:helix-turn-helix domain-containing protein n=1 Tax=Rhizobium sp. PDO1-076 TaxID=1125979 RepID=UPI00024E2979
GYFVFGIEDSSLILSLLPKQIHVSGVERLSTLVKLLIDEAAMDRSGRTLVLTRLVEVLLVESLRLGQTPDAPAGLLRGLGDARLSEAIRQMHTDPARPWTMADLAKEAALSRSAFFDRFSRNVGVPPMEYLLGWRMALAKNLLRQQEIDIAEVAERVGYGSASTFSTAFSRCVGQPPGRYARNSVNQQSVGS